MPEKTSLEKDKVEIRKYLKRIQADYQLDLDDYHETMQQMAVDLLSFDAKKFWLTSRLARDIQHTKEAIKYFEEALKSEDESEYQKFIRDAIIELSLVPGIAETEEELEAEIKLFNEAFKYGTLIGLRQAQEKK